MSAERYLVVGMGALLATLGFAVLLNTPRRALAFAALVGVAGQLANQLLLDMDTTAELAAFAGGLTVGLLAEVGARLHRTPSTVFTITGFIPLVPGTLAFRAITEFLDNQLLVGLSFAVRTMLIGGAIAAGLGVVASATQWRRRSLEGKKL